MQRKIEKDVKYVNLGWVRRAFLTQHTLTFLHFGGGIHHFSFQKCRDVSHVKLSPKMSYVFAQLSNLFETAFRISMLRDSHCLLCVVRKGL